MSPRTRSSRLARLLAATALIVAGCGTRKSPTEPEGDVPDPSATFTRVQALVFTPSCALSGCHAGTAPQRDMDLSAGRAYGQIVGIVSVESSRDRVAPGDVSGSYLVSKVRGDATMTGSRMPLGGPYLPAEKQQLLVDWIRRGAPND